MSVRPIVGSSPANEVFSRLALLMGLGILRGKRTEGARLIPVQGFPCLQRRANRTREPIRKRVAGIVGSAKMKNHPGGGGISRFTLRFLAPGSEGSVFCQSLDVVITKLGCEPRWLWLDRLLRSFLIRGGVLPEVRPIPQVRCRPEGGFRLRGQHRPYWGR